MALPNPEFLPYIRIFNLVIFYHSLVITKLIDKETYYYNK
jgi:hypothetical protein